MLTTGTGWVQPASAVSGARDFVYSAGAPWPPAITCSTPAESRQMPGLLCGSLRVGEVASL